MQVTTEHWVEFPVLYSRFLAPYFMWSSVHMSVPVSQVSPPSSPPHSHDCLPHQWLFLFWNNFILCMTHRAHTGVRFSQVLEMWTMGRAPYIAYSFKDMSLLFNVSQASFSFFLFFFFFLISVSLYKHGTFLLVQVLSPSDQVSGIN